MDPDVLCPKKADKLNLPLSLCETHSIPSRCRLTCILPKLYPFFYPSALRAGGVLSSRSGRAGGRAAAKLAEPISL